MIPRRFFWLFDFLVISAAFLAVYSFFPSIQHLLAGTILLWIPSLERVAAPAAWSGQLPPLLDLLWIFLTITPTSLIVLGVMGNHRPLLQQSRTGILIGGFLTTFFTQLQDVGVWSRHISKSGAQGEKEAFYYDDSGETLGLFRFTKEDHSSDEAFAESNL